LTLAGAGVACYLLLLILQRYPAATERLYSSTVSPLIGQGLSRVTRIVPFSLYEIVLVAVIGIVIVRITIGIGATVRRRRRVANAIASGLLFLAASAGMLVALFYLLWGFNYVRPSLESRLGLERGTAAGIEEVATLTRQLVDAGESAYVAVHGRNDAGSPTALPPDRRTIVAALDSGWDRAARVLALQHSASATYGAPKSPWSSTVARYLGISGGMYFPFTGEALVVRDLPGPQFIKTMAHEQAHQRGTAVEGDANALAYFVCALSPNALVRYAGISFARDQMLAELARRDPKRWRLEWDRMGPGVQRDRRALREYYARTAVATDELANRVNDASLRANRVRGGVQSYGRSTLVFIEYARRNGGRVVPP
jgi:hypothetical protein